MAVLCNCDVLVFCVTVRFSLVFVTYGSVG